jgi:hypothetical protein
MIATAKFPRKGTPVIFAVQRGEHNMLAGRPGIVEGRRGKKITVRCTEAATIFSGQTYVTPKANLKRCRVFIVGPAAGNPHDTVYHVCVTAARDCLDDIYGTDRYSTVETEHSEEAAVAAARRLGANRPTII